jgi:hypothetical protein
VPPPHRSAPAARQAKTHPAPHPQGCTARGGRLGSCEIDRRGAEGGEGCDGKRRRAQDPSAEVASFLLHEWKATSGVVTWRRARMGGAGGYSIFGSLMCDDEE